MASRLGTRQGLYVITDGPRPDLLDVAASALAGGATALQYRDKSQDHDRRRVEAHGLAQLCRAHAALFIVNDDVELARQSKADGVHLGEHDADLALARSHLGPDAIIGVSCYDDLDRARRMVQNGADYIAFGAFFPSLTKPHARHASLSLLRDSATLAVPRVAIGGITPDNAPELIRAGADLVAVISGVFRASDVAAATARYVCLFPKAQEPHP